MPNLSNLNCILIANDNVKQQMKVRLGELSSYGVTILNITHDIEDSIYGTDIVLLDSKLHVKDVYKEGVKVI